MFRFLWNLVHSFHLSLALPFQRAGKLFHSFCCISLATFICIDNFDFYSFINSPHLHKQFSISLDQLWLKLKKKHYSADSVYVHLADKYSQILCFLPLLLVLVVQKTTKATNSAHFAPLTSIYAHSFLESYFCSISQ